MATPREGPNPLRPYYVPPSIGVPSNAAPNVTSPGVARAGAASASSFSFPNLDYSDYLSDASPSVAASAKSLLDKAVWKYTTVLLAQPFEVAKLILQVHVAQDDETSGRVVSESRRREGMSSRERDYAEEDDEEDHSSDDEPNFFTSSTPFAESPSSRSPRRGRQGRPQRHVTDRSGYIPSDHSASSPHRIQLKNTYSLLDALSSLSANSGALSLWRATNTTFIYSLLSRTTETFLRGLLAAIFGIAEADILVPVSTGAIPSSSILTSTAPMASVLIATASAAISSLLLSPIDASRTRLILTPSSRSPRTLWATLSTLSPSYLIPTHLIPITFLTSTLPTLISTSSPLFLKNYLNLDPVLNPNSWSIATFVASAIDLAVRFPLETVLRRAQIVTWTSPRLSPPSSSSSRKAFETIVPVPQAYRGIVPTMYSIIREEGSSSSPKDKAATAFGKPPKRRKGQGVEGLYRGWRVGLWSLVGVWGAGFIGGLQGGAEPATEGVAAHAGKF
jgi:fusion and transport protein UGO1